MRVLFVSSEIYPLAKTGGLADVSAALPRALAALGVEVHLVLPGYPKAMQSAANKVVAAEFPNLIGTGAVRLISGRTPDSGLPIWLVDCPALFRRPGGLYQNEAGREWPDNAQRFALFNHVVARLSLGQLVPEWRADIVHANDWHAGLAPALLAGAGGPRPATVFTMHNLAFQGLFPAAAYPELGLSDHRVGPDELEFYGKISFLKAGIRYSDRLTTVSPTYAQQILTAEYGCGLEGLLQTRASDLVGILNGADYRVWNPATDAHLPANFNPHNLIGKQDCKAALQEEFGLEVDPRIPLVVFMSRITDQKMADVVAAALPEIVASGAQCVLLGDGDRHLEGEIHSAAHGHAGWVVARNNYEEPVAHRLLGGGDILLHPARFEPCGLTQLYAMRYGTLPIVRSTGGLSDTVVDASATNLNEGTATGFAFEQPTAAEMLDCLKHALALYRQPLVWRRIQRKAMAQNFGWADSALRYLALYRGLVSDAMAADDAVKTNTAHEIAAG
ncbi:MAG: glycogen synthase GlgA [Alphaproteobacteria bacterium]|nr:glycogen synthase GlgA [Alphaproteobacteria bacterium]